MQILNYFYFLVITLLGYYYLLSRGKAVCDPFDKQKWIWLSGPEIFWVLTFSTGILAFSAPAGVDLMAIRLLVLELFCVLGLIVSRNRPILTLSICLYGIYLLWLCIGLLYTPSPSYGIRVILKYIYPLLIMLFASSVVRNKEVFLKAGSGARLVALTSILIFSIPFLPLLVSGVFWYGTALAVNYISLSMFSLALFFHLNKKSKNLFFFIIFMLPCFIWVFRTSIIGSTLALITFSFFRYKLKALPFIFLFLVLCVLSVLLIPSIKEKTFFNKNSASIARIQNGKISMDNINSNGRFFMWKWSLDNFYKPKPLTGSGSGNLQGIFYSQKHPFGTLRICHNDYVQILCDNGLIGLFLFGSSFLLAIGHSFLVYQNKKHSTSVRICALTAGSSMAGILLTMYTDNVINYTMATLSYPCGFYGMMLGLIKTEKI